MNLRSLIACGSLICAMLVAGGAHADDRACYGRIAQGPGNGDLARRRVMALADLAQSFHQLQIAREQHEIRRTRHHQRARFLVELGDRDLSVK